MTVTKLPSKGFKEWIKTHKVTAAAIVVILVAFFAVVIMDTVL